MSASFADCPLFHEPDLNLHGKEQTIHQFLGVFALAPEGDPEEPEGTRSRVARRGFRPFFLWFRHGHPPQHTFGGGGWKIA